MICTLATLVAIVAISASRVAEAVEDFHPQTLQQLEQQHSGSPWLLLLWSVDCPPCYRELEQLQQLHQQGMATPVILVAADSVDLRNDVHDVLAEFQLDGPHSYHFASDHLAALRHSIDPQWQGVLPRAYRYDAAGQRTAHSGVLSLSELQHWLDTSAGPDSR